MKPIVSVVDVKEPPAIGKVEMMQGIRTKEAAEAWGAKRGYCTVYWLKSRERVYAEKRQRVDEQAKALEEKSGSLLALSQRGGGYLIGILVVGFVLLCVLAGRPW